MQHQIDNMHARNVRQTAESATSRAEIDSMTRDLTAARQANAALQTANQNMRHAINAGEQAYNNLLNQFNNLGGYADSLEAANAADLTARLAQYEGSQNQGYRNGGYQGGHQGGG